MPTTPPRRKPTTSPAPTRRTAWPTCCRSSAAWGEREAFSQGFRYLFTTLSSVTVTA